MCGREREREQQDRHRKNEQKYDVFVVGKYVIHSLKQLSFLLFRSECHEREMNDVFSFT